MHSPTVIKRSPLPNPLHNFDMVLVICDDDTMQKLSTDTQCMFLVKALYINDISHTQTSHNPRNRSLQRGVTESPQLVRHSAQGCLLFTSKSESDVKGTSLQPMKSVSDVIAAQTYANSHNDHVYYYRHEKPRRQKSNVSTLHAVVTTMRFKREVGGRAFVIFST